MKLAIMQPYFFPYLGYFQLINAVDTFVVYDNVQYTKKGWFNRNRLLFNKKVDFFTINIQKASDYLDVCDRQISPEYFKKEMPKILRKIEQNYKKAPYFEDVYPLVKKSFEFQNDNLFLYIFFSINLLVEFLDIDTKVIKSSDLPLNHQLKNKHRVFDIYKHLNSELYINPTGGHDLYSKQDFSDNGVVLSFLEPVLEEYDQNSTSFEPGLSIIDVMMMNSRTEVKRMLNSYKII